MKTRLMCWLGVSVMLLGGLGCRHCCRRSCAPPCPPAACPTVIPSPVAGTLPPHPLTPSTVAPVVQPTQTPPVPAAGSNGTRGYSPTAPQPEIRLTVPEATTRPPPAARLTQPESAPPNPPSGNEAASLTPALPVAIPQFASVQERVASGLRPLPGGFEWLAANGFRTVLYLRTPNDDDTADRAQVEKLGMKFLSLVVSPETLSKTTVDEFNRVLGDSAGQPLFVYDRDGVLAASLWKVNSPSAQPK